MASLLYGASGLAPWLASAGYLLLCLRLRSKMLVQVLGVAAILFHGAALIPAWFQSESLRFGFAYAMSWMLWLAVLTLWVETWTLRAGRLMIFVYPVAALAALLPLGFPGVPMALEASPLFRLHILLAMLAYSAFFVAAVYAVLMLGQERALHQHEAPSALWDELPPLLALDRLLLRTVALGFGLLTATLLTGGLVLSGEGLGWLRPDHKTVFTLATWAMVALFLWGRARWGWRGRLASRFTLGGFGLLVLAYIGSRFVLEVLIRSNAAPVPPLGTG